MAGIDCLKTTPASVEIRTEPRPPVVDPTLGVPVAVDRTGTPKNRLVTLGDSLTHGFQSGAIFHTELSWPAIVAHELGLSGDEFRYPVYEQPDGPGGLPLDLERFARAFEARYGDSLDWSEIVGALIWLRRYMGAIEDHWERGEGRNLVPTTAPYHNLGVYGWDLIDVRTLDVAQMEQQLKPPPKDNLLGQIVDNDSVLAARIVLDSCRDQHGQPLTALGAAQAMGAQGTDVDPDGPGIETLVVMLGANHALGAVTSLTPCWTPDGYLEMDPAERLQNKGSFNVWQPEHFTFEWAQVVEQIKAVNARHVIVATVPAVTIAPITRGVKGKARARSRYYRHYTRPWISDDQFDDEQDPHLTEDQARAIDSAIDAFNETIIASVLAARTDPVDPRDWYVFDLGIALDRLAAKRYAEDPSAQPVWWTPFPLPPELAALSPAPDTRFFTAGPGGRTSGGIFALDGVHPTTSAYGLIAQEIITIMDGAGVAFTTPTGEARAPGAVKVDFDRILAADSLMSRPPAAINSTLSLLGWLDDKVDWVQRIVPFV